MWLASLGREAADRKASEWVGSEGDDVPWVGRLATSVVSAKNRSAQKNDKKH